jgi:hypothetical protein
MISELALLLRSPGLLTFRGVLSYHVLFPPLPRCIFHTYDIDLCDFLE